MVPDWRAALLIDVCGRLHPQICSETGCPGFQWRGQCCGTASRHPRCLNAAGRPSLGERGVRDWKEPLCFLTGFLLGRLWSWAGGERRGGAEEAAVSSGGVTGAVPVRQ